jgi:hypothetical protein
VVIVATGEVKAFGVTTVDVPCFTDFMAVLDFFGDATETIALKGNGAVIIVGCY